MKINKSKRKAARSGTANQIHNNRNCKGKKKFKQPPERSKYALYEQMKIEFLKKHPAATHEEIQKANISFAKLAGV